MIRYPSDAEVIQAAKEIRRAPEVVLRDLARTVEVLHLAEAEQLNKRVALAGGMAMRCWGNNRLTVFDMDLSAAAAAVSDKESLADAMEYRDDDLQISPASPKDWPPDGKKLWTVAPVRFGFLRSQIEVQEREFKVNVNRRGLEIEAVMLEMPNLYRFDLGLHGRQVPVQDWREATAEKMLAAVVNALSKHFADLDFVTRRFGGELPKQGPEIRKLLELKLERMRALFPNQYDGITLPIITERLRDPGTHLSKIGAEWGKSVQYLGGDSRNYQQAQVMVQRLLEYVF